MLNNAVSKIGLLGLILGNAFFPVLPSGITPPVFKTAATTVTAHFSEPVLPIQNTSSDSYTGVAYPNLYLNRSNGVEPKFISPDLIHFGYDYQHPGFAVPAIPKFMNATTEQSEEPSMLNNLIEQLGDTLKKAAKAVSPHAASIGGLAYFAKDFYKYGLKRALYNGIQGYIEVPAILSYFGTYIDKGLDSAGECLLDASKNAQAAVEPHLESYITDYMKPAVNAVMSREAQNWVSENLIQPVASYLPGLSTVAQLSKFGAGTILGLGLGKVMDKYKMADVHNRLAA